MIIERHHLLNLRGFALEAQRLEGQQQLVLVNLARAIHVVQGKRLQRLLLLLHRQTHLDALRILLARHLSWRTKADQLLQYLHWRSNGTEKV